MSQTETAAPSGVALYNNQLGLWEDMCGYVLNLPASQAPVFAISDGHIIRLTRKGVNEGAVARCYDTDHARQLLMQASFVEVDSTIGKVWKAATSRYLAMSKFGWGFGSNPVEAEKNCRSNTPRSKRLSAKGVDFYRVNPNTEVRGDLSWSYPSGCAPIPVDRNGRVL